MPELCPIWAGNSGNRGTPCLARRGFPRVWLLPLESDSALQAVPRCHARSDQPEAHSAGALLAQQNPAPSQQPRKRLTGAPLPASRTRKGNFLGGISGAAGRYIYPAGGTRARNTGEPHGQNARAEPGKEQGNGRLDRRQVLRRNAYCGNGRAGCHPDSMPGLRTPHQIDLGTLRQWKVYYPGYPQREKSH